MWTCLQDITCKFTSVHVNGGGCYQVLRSPVTLARKCACGSARSCLLLWSKTKNCFITKMKTQTDRNTNFNFHSGHWSDNSCQAFVANCCPQVIAEWPQTIVAEQPVFYAETNAHSGFRLAKEVKEPPKIYLPTQDGLDNKYAQSAQRPSAPTIHVGGSASQGGGTSTTITQTQLHKAARFIMCNLGGGVSQLGGSSTPTTTMQMWLHQADSTYSRARPNKNTQTQGTAIDQVKRTTKRKYRVAKVNSDSQRSWAWRLTTMVGSSLYFAGSNRTVINICTDGKLMAPLASKPVNPTAAEPLNKMRCLVSFLGDCNAVDR